jgi:hypothetical protein
MVDRAPFVGLIISKRSHSSLYSINFYSLFHLTMIQHAEYLHVIPGSKAFGAPL